MSKYENLKLDHQLCFALYAATHALTRAYRGALNKSGLTYTQYLVMLVLWETNGISVSSIGRRLELDSATLTPMLKRLEAAGFIIRSRSSQDERVVEVSLTKTGVELQAEIAKVQQGVECQTGLCDEEFAKLKDSLNRLADNMAKNTSQKEAA
ncbi:MAG: MarR family transcriptional regulator [Methylophilaceae bacterium]|nr:MarR family transcriptional regulator [Methylophilaceae bacterium]MDG1453532.1 MarR family transcriptional regulator [Methylophilaceae bacterium]